ncbi:MAG: type II toxin-antitoxin system VapC family toxin [Gammaproteobacteria bacterium]|nr:MAG: type II toxin-antitoxin system VapC family toxin [Gammaproteobacteria bacterium]
MKLRSRQIELAHRASALAAFARLVADSFTVLPVLGAHFRTASKFADQHTLGLRAGDALHLAIAGDQGATLCSLDKRLADAGSAIGVKTLLL